MSEETSPQHISENEIPENQVEKPTEAVTGRLSSAVKSPLKSLRTYQGDIEEIIGHKQVSMATVVAAEQKRKVERPELTEEPQQSFATELVNKSFVTGGIGLIIFGILIISGVYAFNVFFNTPLVVEQKGSIISFAKKIDLPLIGSNREEFFGFIMREKASPNINANSVVYINPISTTTNSATIADVSSLLAPAMPAVLARSLDTTYMLGIYASDINEPFIILTTQDYARGYAGMLKWEETMIQDVGPLFSIDPTGLSYKFTDESVQNKDLRIISDNNRKTILLYAFLDKNTIVITSNEKTFSALLGKFVTNKMVR